jgi:hypothetical protein
MRKVAIFSLLLTAGMVGAWLLPGLAGRRIQGIKSAAQAQRFLAAYGPIAQHCRPRSHFLPASASRHEMAQCFRIWQKITGIAAA